MSFLILVVKDPMACAGCMMPWMNYTPRTAKEIIAMDKRYSTSEIVR